MQERDDKNPRVEYDRRSTSVEKIQIHKITFKSKTDGNRYTLGFFVKIKEAAEDSADKYKGIYLSVESDGDESQLFSVDERPGVVGETAALTDAQKVMLGNILARFSKIITAFETDNETSVIDLVTF